MKYCIGAFRINKLKDTKNTPEFSMVQSSFSFSATKIKFPPKNRQLEYGQKPGGIKPKVLD